MDHGAFAAMRTSPWRASRSLLAVAALLLAMAGLAGCGAAGGGEEQGWFVRYERVSADGVSERQEIWPDGRLLMWHGEHLERLTLSDADVASLQAALEGDIPVGTAEDLPRRSLTLGDGTVVDAPRPDPGTVTELLERLLDRHTLAP